METSGSTDPIMDDQLGPAEDTFAPPPQEPAQAATAEAGQAPLEPHDLPLPATAAPQPQEAHAPTADAEGPTDPDPLSRMAPAEDTFAPPPQEPAQAPAAEAGQAPLEPHDLPRPAAAAAQPQEAHAPTADAEGPTDPDPLSRMAPAEDLADEDAEAEEESAELEGSYAHLTREQLVDTLKSILSGKPIQRVRGDVESIKVNFYKKHKQEFERKRKEWVEGGGELEAFQPPDDPIEPEFKSLLKEYRERKSEYNRSQDDQKLQNLERKQRIIERIKDLVNRNESVNQTFQEFRELQQQWREIGPVPQANLNDLWETYHHHVQNFYDYIKINKELRDLDLKKNLDEKIKLCEKAEELLLESSVVNAFKKLQTYHNQWREIGPVPNEHRTEIWERLKEVTSKINRKHQEHFEGVRDEQRANLEAKTALCEKAEEIAAQVISSSKDWSTRTQEMVELQRVWKTIGFAPRKDNNRIYERFRTACDSFFSTKRDFYEEALEEHQNNLQLKTELCMQAEALKNSTDWKKTADELVTLQKRWKEIGPVPRRHSEKIWKRFRTACDHFFQQKAKHFSQADGQYEENLRAKEALIDTIERYQPTEDVEANLNALKEFQRQWAEIGFVPFRRKEEVQKRYREAINKHFERLSVDDGKRNILRFKSKIGVIQGNPHQENKMRHERERLFNQLRQLENDIVLWENNIGFFAKSKNAEQLIKDVERKIAKGREDVKMLEAKIRLIDGMDQG